MILVFTALLATVALLGIHLLKRGNVVGRGGLMAVSVAAAVWAVTPCFDLAFEPPADLATLLSR